jgi:hypothetical protein
MKDNHDETVICCENWDDYKRLLAADQADKYFLADVRPQTDEVLQPAEFRARYLHPERGYWFRLVNEANSLRDAGLYQPRVPADIQGLPDGFWDAVGPDRTLVLLHWRNIAKCPEKNVDAGMAMQMLAMLRSAWETAEFTTVLIGNDWALIPGLVAFRHALRLDPKMKIIDMRNQLSLGQIKRLLEFADMFVGKDSGMAHVAATLVPSLVYGFSSMAWAPKGPAPVTAFERGRETEFLAEIPVMWERVLGEVAAIG